MENVTSINVWIHDAVNRPGWDEYKCSEMRTVLPRLRKVLLHDATYVVWELEGQTWVDREVDGFTAWDIIRGACDNL
jgi:hypothetical protein